MEEVRGMSPKRHSVLGAVLFLVLCTSSLLYVDRREVEAVEETLQQGDRDAGYQGLWVRARVRGTSPRDTPAADQEVNSLAVNDELISLLHDLEVDLLKGMDEREAQWEAKLNIALAEKLASLETTISTRTENGTGQQQQQQQVQGQVEATNNNGVPTKTLSMAGASSISESSEQEATEEGRAEANQQVASVEATETSSGATAEDPPEEVTRELLESIIDVNGAVGVATKLTPEGQIDWSYYDAIQFFHVRKAGGTTIVDWMKRVGEKFGLQVFHDEYIMYDPQRYADHKVLRFTNFRPPVERVISSYQYDGLAHIITPLLLESKKASDKDIEDIQKDYTIQKFYEESNYKNIHRPNRVGECATECYSKWFGDWPTPDFEPDTATAAKRLNDLEVVWIKNLGNENYTNWVLHRWNALDIPFYHKRSASPVTMHETTQNEIELLRKGNQKDELLYEVMKQKWSRITNITLV